LRSPFPSRFLRRVMFSIAHIGCPWPTSFPAGRARRSRRSTSCSRSTVRTIAIPDETTIREFLIQNPNSTLLIPRDLSRLSSIPYSPIITMQYDRRGN
jgi:hypothetical protein